MKNLLVFTAFIFAALFCLSYNSNSQWLNDFRLESDLTSSQTAGNNGKSIIVKGDTVIVVWQTATNPTVSLYSKRSTNGGLSWQDSVRVEASYSYESYNPAAAISNNKCYVAHIRKESGIYYVRISVSHDFGNTWGYSYLVQGNDGYSKSEPSICADSANIHVVFTYKSNTGVERIMYRRSTNTGYDFNFSTTWFTTAEAQTLPSITFSGTKLYMSYTEVTDGNGDIKFLGSSNNGGSWQSFQITNDTSSQTRSSIAGTGDHVYIVWNDSKYGSIDIIAKRSTNGGSSWFTETRLTSHSSDQYRANIAANGTNVHIVWEDNRDNNEIYYLSGTNYGAAWQSIVRLTDNSAVSKLPSIAVSGNTVHVVWIDERTGDGDVYYKRNPTGNTIGITNTGTGIPNKCELLQNYPNPFNPTTQFGFRIADFGLVRLTVFDALGRDVDVLVNQQLQPGTYEVSWDASNYPSGVYYYRLQASDPSTSLRVTETKKMILLK